MAAYSGSEAHLVACVQAFWNAYQYFRIIDDVLGQAKTLARVAQAQLQVVFSELSKSSRCGDDVHAKISRALQPAELAIELCSDIGYAPLMIRCALNVAELRYLSGQGYANYWNEALRLMNRLYLVVEKGSNDFRVPVDTPPGMTVKILEHTTRLVRMLFESTSGFAKKDEELEVFSHDGLLASWTWLCDKCWYQHSKCDQLVLKGGFVSRVSLTDPWAPREGNSFSQDDDTMFRPAPSASETSNASSVVDLSSRKVRSATEPEAYATRRRGLSSPIAYRKNARISSPSIPRDTESARKTVPASSVGEESGMSLRVGLGDGHKSMRDIKVGNMMWKNCDRSESVDSGGASFRDQSMRTVSLLDFLIVWSLASSETCGNFITSSISLPMATLRATCV